jgi:hypothetical protein
VGRFAADGCGNPGAGAEDDEGRGPDDNVDAAEQDRLASDDLQRVIETE